MEGWLLGVLLTIVSAAGSTTGLILQKMAHVKEEENRNIQNISNVDEVVENTTTTGLQDNNDNDVKKCFGMPCNKYFIAGFIMLVFVPSKFTNSLLKFNFLSQFLISSSPLVSVIIISILGYVLQIRKDFRKFCKNT